MTKPLRILLVDDERLVRQHIRHALASIEGIEVVGEAGSKEEAVKAVGKLRPDLLLLDIHMPGGDGFAVLEALAEPPAVIFVTSFDQHAVRAFEVNALDFVMKPTDTTRLRAAIERARRRLGGAEPEVAPGVLGVTDAALIEIGGSGHFVAVGHILAIEAAGNYSHVTVLGGKRHVARQQIKEWSRRLPQDVFVQLDRGLIINRSSIQSAEFATRAASVRLGDLRDPLELGAVAASRLKELLRR